MVTDKECESKDMESSIYDPRKYYSEEALTRLALFCGWSNKSSTTLHPCDEIKWFDFICYTIREEKEFDRDGLFNLLTDEEYWGAFASEQRKAGHPFTWSKEQAKVLVAEYEKACRILKYYAEITRNA